MKNDVTVLVTGAAGHLGSHAVTLLLAKGFRVRGLDMADPAEPLPDACEFRKAPLADDEVLKGMLDGVDVIVHAAALHPWKEYTDDQYLDANIKGTWHLYTAAAAAGVGRVVLTSSIAASACQNVPPETWPVSEDLQLPPGDLYGLTKHVQENIARLFAETGKVRTIAIRPPAFMPRPAFETCCALTGTFAVVDDVAAGHAAAVEVMAGVREPGGPMGAFEAFYVTNSLRYTKEDVRELGVDPAALARKYWPEAVEWLEEQGYSGSWLPAVYDLSKAERLLGWRPEFNFEQAYAALREARG